MSSGASIWTSSVPATWVSGRLKHLFEPPKNGVWGEDSRGDDSDVLCVRAADFDYEAQRVSDKVLPRRSVDSAAKPKHILRIGDIVLEKSGGGEQQPVGRAVRFDLAEAAVCSNFCARLRPQPQVDSRFATYSLAAAYGSGLSQRHVKQTTGIQNLDAQSFLAEFWALPPLAEQRRIADFLDAETLRVDRLASAYRQAHASLLKRRGSSVHAWVTGSRYPHRGRSGLMWSPTLPENWPTAKLSLVARMGSGHTPSRSHPEWWVDCTIPWITTGEVAQIRDDRRETLAETRELISWIGLANSAAELHPTGTVVLSRTASAGFSAVMGREMATSQDYVTWTCGPRLDPYYLLWCLRAMRSDLLGRLATGSTHKTIYMPDLEALRVPLPPLDEQRKIVDQIRTSNEQIDQLVDLIHRQLSLLSERRQALITAAVTGQIDVTTARGVID